MAYRITKGQIKRVHSKLLDENLSDENIPIDKTLKREVQQAIKLFQTRDQDNLKTALTTMANAFEREICKAIASDSEKLEEMINSHFSHITKISNNCDIRHKESGKIIIDDKFMQEYLFYTYYNAIRLMISKI